MNRRTDDKHDELERAFAAWFKALYVERGFVSSEKELREAFFAGVALNNSLAPSSRGEPVAYVVDPTEANFDDMRVKFIKTEIGTLLPVGTPLYATPPANRHGADGLSEPRTANDAPLAGSLPSATRAIDIPDTIRRSTWKTRELRDSAAKLVEVILKECQ